MTPEALAALHARCFSDAPRPWTAAEFAGLLDLSSMLLVARPGGFALGQVAGPEVELLTLAVDPSERRRGIGQGLLGDFERAAVVRGAVDAFLEVAESNLAARALYAAAGYQPVGRRRDYYRPPAQPAVDALLLRKPLPGVEENSFDRLGR